MVNEYEIQQIRGTVDKHLSRETWDSIKPLSVSYFPWEQNGYRPTTTAKIAYSGNGLFVRFEACETSVRAVNKLPNSPVCQDSCVELFINPCPDKTEQYVNFEINPVGTALVGIGKGRNDRRLIGGDLYQTIQIQTSVCKDNLEDFSGPMWSIDLSVPFDFLRELFGEIDFLPGHVMKGNLYKCGDLTKYPHYGCWNQVVWEYPDFHRPEHFGVFVLK